MKTVKAEQLSEGPDVSTAPAVRVVRVLRRSVFYQPSPRGNRWTPGAYYGNPGTDLARGAGVLSRSSS